MMVASRAEGCRSGQEFASEKRAFQLKLSRKSPVSPPVIVETKPMSPYFFAGLTGSSSCASQGPLPMCGNPDHGSWTSKQGIKKRLLGDEGQEESQKMWLPTPFLFENVLALMFFSQLALVREICDLGWDGLCGGRPSSSAESGE